MLFLISCQVTETICLNQDGTGEIETELLRDEHRCMQFIAENHSKEDVFLDTTYVFKDLITKNSETFSKLPASEKAIFKKITTVKVHSKKSSFEKEFCIIISQKLNTIAEVADLYKTEE